MSLNPYLIQKLNEIQTKYEKLENQLVDPKILANHEIFQKIAKGHAELIELVSTFKQYNKLTTEISENRALMNNSDPEIVELARTEIETNNTLLANLEKYLALLLLPKDLLNNKNVLLEIRAGTGGEEASLFVTDLLRMYLRFAEGHRWKSEILSQNESISGGLKEVIVFIIGNGVYSQLKYESGVHRVQRIPSTETQGRIHTSAVTVAVLPEADEIEVNIRPEDLRIDCYRSTGAGGQHINTTDSAVRITHIQSGLVVTCQDERSQHKNRAKAMKVLTARLFDLKLQEQQRAQASARKNMIGTGNRSERIRTYNFPQNRITDHRIGLTLYKLETVLNGELSSILSPLLAYFQADSLKNTSF